MARLNEARNWAARLFDGLTRRALGKGLTSIRIAAHRPGLLCARAAMEAALRGGLLDPRLKTLASLRVAIRAGCPH
jgi:alkylhydroperoxidase family enzyme